MLNNCQFKLNAKRERDGVGGAGGGSGREVDTTFFMPPAFVICSSRIALPAPLLG